MWPLLGFIFIYITDMFCIKFTWEIKFLSHYDTSKLQTFISSMIHIQK